MATIHFFLKDKSAQKTPVILYIRWGGERLKQYIGESIDPKYWNSKTERAKEVKSFPEYPEFNQRLNNAEKTAKDVYRQFLNDNQHRQPTKGELRESLRQALKRDPKKNQEFMAFFQRHIEEAKRLRGDKTIKWYGNTLNKLLDFEKHTRTNLTFQAIDMTFYNDFIGYLQQEQIIKDEEGQIKRRYFLSNNAIGKHIQNIKAVLSSAEGRGLPVNPAYRLKSFKKLREESLNIALNEEELSAMNELDLSETPRLERVRDLFLVGCWTGLRYSDFSKIRREYIQGDYLIIPISQKQKNPIRIPLHPVVKSILEKYKDNENSLPPTISDVKLREYIKEVGKMIPELHTPILKSMTKGGKASTVQKMKYEMIGTHTARRSFATTQYNAGVDTYTIMQITGHKTEKAFLTYIKTTSKEHALKLKEHWDEKYKLKKV